MKRSTERILTTHVGSLPIPEGLDPLAADYEARLRREVDAIVRRQVEVGIDVVNDGELGKRHWLAYLDERLGGFEQRAASPDRKPALLQGKDRADFPGYYTEATRMGTLFYSSGYQSASPSSRPTVSVCVAPVSYIGQRFIQRDVDNLRAALGGVSVTESFLPVTAPASIEPYRENDYYKSDKEFVYALADALRVEYETIASAGFLVQVDDAWTAALWDRIGIAMGLASYRKRCLLRVEALNHALERIPEDRIRYHICWGSWHGPHANDITLADLLEVILAVKAGAYLFEAANVRHEHEYQVWETARLPEGRILIPGVVSHATNLVEHPDLVAGRIQRFARIVGKENVIAGTDCGFGGRIHHEIAWAKLQSLVEGARRATVALRYH